MLKKLLKYDFKKLYKVMIVFYVLAIVFAIIARILLNIEGAIIWFILGQIALGATWAMTINALINGVIRICVNFRLSIYGDEAYLTHTLPVKTSTIYFEKFILGAIVVFTSLVVSILALYIAYFPFNEMGNILDLLNQTLGTEKYLAAIFLFGIFYIEILSALSAAIAGIVFGYKKASKKSLWSVVFGFLFYGLTQIIIVLSLFGLGLFDKNVLELFNVGNTIISPNVIKESAICALIIYSICVASLHLIAGKQVCRGVDVE